MKVAYVDTSCLVAIAFDEPGGRTVARRLARVDEVFSANLLEAELRAALAREGVDMDERLLARIGWVLPDRSLGPEIVRVLGVKPLRGADLWHVACGLYLAADPSRISFLSLDKRQRETAASLGFAV